MRVCSFLCSDSLLYTSFFFFLFYMVFIHVIVHEFYHEKYPTLDMLLVAVREMGIFSGECTTLWKILRTMGIKHKKVNDIWYIYEQAHIILQWHEYLRCLRRNRREL